VRPAPLKAAAAFWLTLCDEVFFYGPAVWALLAIKKLNKTAAKNEIFVLIFVCFSMTKEDK